MNFAEKLKKERSNRGWSQDELAQKLFVSRQSVSKWETGQNYPSMETLIKLSGLFDTIIDELLKSDEELKDKVIQDSRQLAHPGLKLCFDILFLLGVFLLLIKLAVLLLNKIINLDLVLYGNKFFWNFGSLFLMIGAAVGSNWVRRRYKED